MIVFKRRQIITLLALTLVSLKMQAQYDVSFGHYFDLEPSFNAAAVGKESKINIALDYALDLAGYEHNPQTMYAAADMPLYFLKTYHGVGLQFMNDKLGLFSHQRLMVQYALKFKLLKGMFSVGVAAGLLSETFDGSKLDLEDSNDPAFSSSKLEGNGFDLGVGLYYTHRNWYVGASAQHLTAPTVSLGERNELKVDPTFYLTGGYNIKLRNPFLTIKSSVLARTDLVGYRADVTARLVYTNESKMMYAGVGYSPTNSVTFMLGGNFHVIMLGYSYEMYTSAINPGNGSHELFLGYQVDINLTKKGKNKHQSVRIL